MEDEGGEEPPAPGTEEDALLKPLLRPAVSRSQVSKAGPRSVSPASKQAVTPLSPIGAV